jgi:hypothetical protein
VSVALPGDAEVSEDTPLRTVYLAKTGELLVSVAVGPALDCRSPGLTDDEQLKKQATTIWRIMYGWRLNRESERALAMLRSMDIRDLSPSSVLRSAISPTSTECSDSCLRRGERLCQ